MFKREYGKKKEVFSPKVSSKTKPTPKAKVVEVVEKPKLVKVKYVGPYPLPYNYYGTIFNPIAEVEPEMAEALLKAPQRWKKVD